MKVLIACECSGVVRRAFAARGHMAVSCDLLPADDGEIEHHHTGSVLDILDMGWDLMIAHPPCTYLSVSGMHWTTRGLRDPKLTEDALDFVRILFAANIPLKCIENPVSVISSRIRKPDQIIQPYDFGHDASKKTCLWLEGLPLLISTKFIAPRLVKLSEGKWAQRWGNQTDSGQNRLGPSEERAKLRSETYKGIADAMAEQWGEE